MDKKRTIYIIVCLCIILFLVYSLIMVENKKNNYNLELDIEQNNNVNNPINYKEIIDDLKIQYNNDDVVGILEINGTDYIAPIMQGKDNDYYLNHTPDGKSNFMGSIYLDYRVDIDSGKKLLIYGHNSSKVEMPFAILEEFYDKDYYDNHKYIEVTTSTTKKKYEIFSVYVETDDFSYMNINFENEKEYLKHLQNLKERSMYDTEVELTKDDEVLILQTCSTHSDYRNYEKKYLLIISRRV